MSGDRFRSTVDLEALGYEPLALETFRQATAAGYMLIREDEWYRMTNPDPHANALERFLWFSDREKDAEWHRQNAGGALRPLP